MKNIDEMIAKNLAAPFAFGIIHGSGEECFENIAFRVGMYDGAGDEIYDIYLKRFQEKEGALGTEFVRAMVMNCLIFMGKKLGRHDENLKEAYSERLETMAKFAKSGAPIFYTDAEREGKRGVPQAWKNEKMVRKENTAPRLRLPNMYDLMGMAAVYGEGEDDGKIDEIVGYILSDEYQKEVEKGYGIGENGENGFVKSKYYAVGWSINLKTVKSRELLQSITLLSKTKAARESKTYKEAKKTLQEQKTIAEIAKPARATYWTSGCYMDFGSSKKEESIKAKIEALP